MTKMKTRKKMTFCYYKISYINT